MSENTSIELRQWIDSTVNQAFGELYYSHFENLMRAASLCLSFIAIYIFYEYIEYLVILDAYNYEKSTRKRYNFVRRMAHKLQELSIEYGDFYFCYLPMNHGVNVPPTYTLFQAIKEVLNMNNRPASRRICISILMELAHSGYNIESGNLIRDKDVFDRKTGADDAINDFNMNILQFTKEMVTFGVKDLEIMVSLHHLIEAISEN